MDNIQNIIKTGYVKKKDGSIHQVQNYISDTQVRLRYHSTPTSINKLESATEQDYKTFIKKSNETNINE